MTSKLKKLKDLNRKLTVNVETKKYDEKYQAKLNKIRSTVKLDGFRKGKVPNDVLVQKYGPSIHYEVLNEVIHELLHSIPHSELKVHIFELAHRLVLCPF